MRTVVTGAGGFIGGHLTAALLAEGHEVRAADIKPASAWWQYHPDAENLDRCDLNDPAGCRRVMAGGADEVYHLACDMGGMGFIEAYRAACMLNVLNSTSMIAAARDAGCGRYFYASTACVYRHDRQDRAVPERGLREDDDVYPAGPEDGYGWEKLFSERMCRHFREDWGMVTRVARFHTVYGPHETWRGGREKVPAALCRKIAMAKARGERSVEVWGDGNQGRSFLYVSDAVRGILALMRSGCETPVNIGSEHLISVNDLARLVMGIAGHEVELVHVPGPLGVRGRYADLAKARRETGWEPEVSLRDGMTATWEWIEDRVKAALG